MMSQPRVNPFLRFLIRLLSGCDVRVLEKSAIDAARKLLFQVYFEEQKWVPEKGNPSGLQIRDGMYIDKFDYTCTWIGLFTNSFGVPSLSGVGRIVNGSETALYLKNLPEKEYFLRKGTCEGNRIALLKGTRGHFLYALLCVCIVNVASRSGNNRLVGACPASILPFYTRIGAESSFTFHYNAGEMPCVAMSISTNAESQCQMVIAFVIRVMLNKFSRGGRKTR